jgi:hypothetical protein
MNKVRLKIASWFRKKSISPTKLNRGLIPSDDGAAALPDGVAIVSLSEKTTKYSCGHIGYEMFKVVFYGQTDEAIWPRDDRAGRRIKCPACMVVELFSKTNRCALCGSVIMPSDPVAKYKINTANRKFLTDANTLGDDCIGCLRNDCCPSGGFFAGHWDGKKVVDQFGGQILAAHVHATGQPVIISTEK